MFFFTFHGVPASPEAQSEGAAGAYINCWVLGESLDAAEANARQAIEAQGWKIMGLEESKTVDRSTYLENEVGLQYFEQAELDGAVFAMYMYPP
jgi:hypothetical protein